MRIVLLSALICLAACGGAEKAAQRSGTPPVESDQTAPLAPPTAEAARQIVESSAEWSDFQFTYASWSLPLRAKEMNEVHRKNVQELREAGWLSVDGDGSAILTEKAKDDRRFLVRSNASLDIVPLAKKEIVSLSSPQTLPDGNQQVVIDWKWIPNEIGAALRSGLVAQVFASPHQAKATLMPSEGKWIVLIIEPVAP